MPCDYQDLKDPRRRDELAAARAMLKKNTMMLLTTSKVRCLTVVGVCVCVCVCFRQDFYGSSHISELEIGSPVVTMPGAW